jgi:ATP synthase protein I
MPESGDDDPETLGSLDERLTAFEASRRKAPSVGFAHAGASVGYRLIAQMLGGMFGGVGLGWLVDRFAHTRGIAIMAGLLIGSTVAVISTIRSASRMATGSQTSATPASADNKDDGA